MWGWGCNARGQLGPLAPSSSVVVQPQRLHVLQAGALLDSISTHAPAYSHARVLMSCVQSQGCTTPQYSRGRPGRWQTRALKGAWMS